MSQYWENIAAKSNGEQTPEDFETAAYRLVVEQVLYHTDRHSRAAYWLVDRYERDFRQALAPLGITLDVNRQKRYAYAKPQFAKAGTATGAQTRMALVLRAIYDESARLGQFTDEGEVACDLVELSEKYKLMTGREFPSKGDFAALMRTMKRWGIAKRSDDSESGIEGENEIVVIRPAIAEILGETALQRLAQWNTNDPASPDLPEEEVTEENEENEVTDEAS